MLKRTARRILAWSVVFAMLFSLTVQPVAAADTSGDSSAAAYSAQLDEAEAEETAESESAESDEAEEAEAETGDTGQEDADASTGQETADASTGEDTGEEADSGEAVVISEEESYSQSATPVLGVSPSEYDADGFYTDDDATYYEPATLNEDGVYEISNAGQLFWFAALVNGDTTQEDITEAVTDADAVLTADIDLESATWTPIGSNSKIYNGCFDGGGYTISGLYINNNSSYQGLFGYVGEGGTVQNLTVEGSVTGYDDAAGVVGYNEGTVTNCTSSVTVIGINVAYYVGGVVGYNEGTVTNCTNDGEVSSYRGVGGVVGLNEGSVTNCCNTGTVSGSYVGGVVGYNYYGTVSYCCNSGTVSGTNNAGGVIGAIVSGTITNCYYLSGTQSDSKATSKTADEFASGEVAYLLNESVSGGTTWYQTIGTDEYPVLDSTHGTVYYGYTSCTSTTAVYSNKKLSSTQGHSFDENGSCTSCGYYEPATLNSDGYYEISNAGQLFWFAALVNGDTSNAEIDAQDTAANAVLTCDISLRHYSWTKAIGYRSSSRYSGTFDGSGYTISYFDIENYEYEDLGLFGWIAASGTVQNVILDGYTYNPYTYMLTSAGSIAARNYGTIANCISSCDFSAPLSGAEYFGGLVGYNAGTITDCGYASNTYITGGKYTGGLVGLNDTAGIIGELLQRRCRR